MTTSVITAASALPVDILELRLNRRLGSNADQDAELLSEARTALTNAETITRHQVMMTKRKLVLDRFPCEFGWPIGVWPTSDGALIPSDIDRQAISIPNPPLVAITAISYVDTAGAAQTLDVDTDIIVDKLSHPGRIIPAYGTTWPQTQRRINAVEIDFICGYAVECTADAAANKLAPIGVCNQFTDGDIVRLSNSGGALPAPLLADTDYYVLAPISPSPPNADNSIQLATTLDGSAIDITGAGTGTSYIGVVPEGIKRWIILRAGTKFENREEVAVLNRGAIQTFGYVDRLLDPWKDLAI